eukprot:113183-Pelagomonas_calceolata.AAC.5
MHAARQHQSSMIWPELPFRWMKSLAPFRMRKAKQRLNKQLKEGHSDCHNGFTVRPRADAL